MKPIFKCRLLLLGAALLGPAMLATLTAQTCTVLHTFTGPDGANAGGLVLSGNTLYGTTASGGITNTYAPSGFGTVFKVNTDGTGFAVLHYFQLGEGQNPQLPMMLSGSTLYGVANNLLFRIGTDGSGYTILWNFGATGGVGSMLLSGTTLYCTGNGGSAGYGTVFKINTDGSGYTLLYDFGTGNGSGGIYPVGLVLSGSTLYGTASMGGSQDNGTVFRVNTNGTGFAVLHSFSAMNNTTFANFGGAYPETMPALAGSTLYGTAYYGGSFGDGTLYKVNTTGGAFTVLTNWAFGGGDPRPLAGLLVSGSTLYGTTEGGLLYKMKTDGTGYTQLLNGPVWANPYSPPILAGSTLYGTGNSGSLVYSLNLSPVLNCVPQAGQLVLTWTDPTFALQAAPAVMGAYTNIPNATSPYTNAESGAQQFFRLVSK